MRSIALAREAVAALLGDGSRFAAEAKRLEDAGLEDAARAAEDQALAFSRDARLIAAETGDAELIRVCDLP